MSAERASPRSEVQLEDDLCAYCKREVFSETAWQQLWASQPYPSNNAFVLSRQYSEVQHSSESGCWICSHILDNVIRASWKTKGTAYPWKFGYSLNSPVVGKPRKVNILAIKVMIPAKPWWRTIMVNLPMYVIPASAGSQYIMAPEITASGEPVSTPDLLTSWLSECKCNHASCAKADRVKLPSRLLDAAVLLGDPDIVRLHAAQDGEVGEYAALSYCWGEVKDRFVITANTLQAAQQEIRWSSLHRTYQDAIEVCRKLGIRYLWIDAVCILQDEDNADKVVEMPRMHQYYKNATVVISAADSLHADAGFLKHYQDFSSRRPLGGHLCRVPAWGPQGESIDLRLGSDYDVYQPEKTAIETRGWTLQERLLAPRVMHFLSNGSILMVCEDGTIHNELVVFETFYPPRNSIHRMYQGDTPFYDSISPAMNPVVAENHHVFGSWLALVTEYSNRRLTEPSDKLVAFASLAQEYYLTHSALLGDYHAGVWSKKLLACLCWKTRQQITTTVPYRAPSWSWASADSAFYELGDEAESHEIFSVSAIQMETWPKIAGFSFGPVSHASLKLRARCREGLWRLQSANTELHKQVSVMIDSHSSTPAQADHSDELPTSEATKVLLLALGRRPETEEGVDGVRVICLVLKAVESSVYRRVGFLSDYRIAPLEVAKWSYKSITIN